ncbi:hypothetical protein D3C73_1041200 [compost metagenome]
MPVLCLSGSARRYYCCPHHRQRRDFDQPLIPQPLRMQHLAVLIPPLLMELICTGYRQQARCIKG